MLLMGQMPSHTRQHLLLEVESFADVDARPFGGVQYRPDGVAVDATQPHALHQLSGRGLHRWHVILGREVPAEVTADKVDASTGGFFSNDDDVAEALCATVVLHSIDVTSNTTL